MKGKATVILENMRRLFLGSTLLSMLMTATKLDYVIIVLGIVTGAYYGFKIEKELEIY